METSSRVFVELRDFGRHLGIAVVDGKMGMDQAVEPSYISREEAQKLANDLFRSGFVPTQLIEETAKIETMARDLQKLLYGMAGPR